MTAFFNSSESEGVVEPAAEGDRELPKKEGMMGRLPDLVQILALQEWIE